MASSHTNKQSTSTWSSTTSEKTPLISNARIHHPAPGQSKLSSLDRLTFGWFTSLLDRGNSKKHLDQEDLELIPVPPDCTTRIACSVFEFYWDQEKKSPNPSLVRALFRAFGAQYIQAGFLKLIHDLCIFVGPQVLHAMIVFLRDPDAPLWHGFALTAAVTISQLTMSLCLRHYFFKCYTTGLKIRTGIVTIVYRKALLLSAAERQQRTLGEITNLMSIDAQRLQDLTTFLHSLWSSPLQIMIAMYFLWGQLGPSCLGGIGVILLMIPVTKTFAQWISSMQAKLMEAKDRRIELNSEVLSGMKIIKLQAWEESFQKRILSLREAELVQLWRYYVGLAITELLWVCTPLAVALATFAAYVWSGHKLDVASALTALALFEILRFPLYMLPHMVNGTMEAIVSVKRVQNFLLSEEFKRIGPNGMDSVGVRMENVSAAYDSKKPKADKAEKKELVDADWEITLVESQLDEAERRIQQLTGRQLSVEDAPSSLLCLKRIDFECKPGELIAIVGSVGCGKSSFINALLGEVRQLSGTTSVNGQLAYFSQSPFIMNASVRDNILFGHIDEHFNRALYERALDCCALRHDLELLPDGDATEIGEKGVTLSGGQKARVALARAVYHGADITLIDDALSAVDAHVAEHLFEEAIVGELMKRRSTSSSPRSVILVTNALQYLKHARVNRIVVIQDGRIVEEGTYRSLSQKKGSVFSRYLSALSESGVSSSGTKSRPKSPASSKAKGEDKPKEDKEEDKKVAKKLMTEETRQTGHVDWRVYLSWAKAAGGIWVPFIIVVAFTVQESTSILANWYLTWWSSHGNLHSQGYFLAWYALINLSTAVVGLMRSIIIAFLCLSASRKVRLQMLLGRLFCLASISYVFYAAIRISSCRRSTRSNVVL